MTDRPMNTFMLTRLRRGTLLLAMLMLAGCSLDVENPNAPTEQEVLTNVEGIIQLAVGMQDEFASSIEEFMVPNSLVTDEWGTGTRALAAYTSLWTGEGFDRSFGVVEAPWASAYRVVKEANRLIDNVGNVRLAASTQTGIVALAELFKAMALGMIYLEYERGPINVEVEHPTPVPRAEILDEVIRLLESAHARLQTVSDPDLAGFRQRVLPSAFDIRNVTNAMLARYYLFDGRFQQAIEAADRVPLNSLSVFPFQSPDINPIYNLSVVARYVFGLPQFVAEAEAGDRRPAFWLKVNETVDSNEPSITPVLHPLNQYDDAGDAFPVYLPDEMRLIKAEAYTRLGDFARARALINEVRTQTTAAVAEPVAGLSALPATALDSEAELLAQIAYERRYELYMQALRWEDFRRLDAVIDEEPVLRFLPIPEQECEANPNAGC